MRYQLIVDDEPMGEPLTLEEATRYARSFNSQPDDPEGHEARQGKSLEDLVIAGTDTCHYLGPDTFDRETYLVEV